jgi:hypothetical protein
MKNKPALRDHKQQRIESMLERIERAQERAQRYVSSGESLVEELLAERRLAARNEWRCA